MTLTYDEMSATFWIIPSVVVDQ